MINDTQKGSNMRNLHMVEKITKAQKDAEAVAATAPETNYDCDWFHGENYYQYGEVSFPIHIFSKREYIKLYTLLENLLNGGVLYDSETGNIIDFADNFHPVTGVFLLRIKCRLEFHHSRYTNTTRWKKYKSYYWRLEPVI
jgi:hypothetical protein